MTSSVPTSQIETRKKGKSRLSPSKQGQANDNGQHSDSARLYEPGDIVWAKLGHFAWWPAIIFSSPVEQNFTRTFDRNGRRKKEFFVYFYGKSIQSAWISSRSIIEFSGLEKFIRDAKVSVENAKTKSQKAQLANRFQLKVSTSKRAEWDEAIGSANRDFELKKSSRIKKFEQIFKEKKRKNRVKKHEKLGETKRRRTNSEVEYDFVPPEKKISIRLENPPLSNFEQKQIAEALLNHEQSSTLTFEQAQSFCKKKAVEIVLENFREKIDEPTDEWFYDVILLKNPSLVFKHRCWFGNVSTDEIPNENEAISVKQWLIALMIETKARIEDKKLH